MDRQEYHIGIKVKVFPIKATKAYRRRKLQFHSFFSSAPDGDEWPVSLRGRFRLIHRYHPNPATSQVVLQPATRIPPQPSHKSSCASACHTDTNPTQPQVKLCFSLPHGYHPNPTTPKLQHTSKQDHTTNVVIQ